LMTQVLVAGLLAFGMGSGAPKRHPTEVQVRWVTPGSALVVGPSVSVPLGGSHVVILVKEVPMSGTTEGSGAPTPAAPK